MRVVLVTDSYLPVLGGIELHVRDLADQLVAAGHVVDVLTRTPAGPDPDPGGDVRVVRLGRTDRMSGLLAAADVVHVHSSVVSPTAWRAAALARALDVPALVTVHSMVSHGAARPMAVALRRATASGLGWSAVSRAVADPLSRTVGVPVSLLPNGIDPTEWRDCHAHRVEAPGFTVVSALRFAARKRPLALVRVLADLRDRLPADVPLRAVLVGDGRLLPAVQRKLAATGLADQVELPGRLDRAGVQRVLTGADAYVAPARLESFGLAALEARCAGVPVVAMAASGVTEFVRHDVEGLLAADDADAARLLHVLATDPERRERIRRHNVDTDPQVTWPQVLAETLRQYAAAGAPVGVTV
ncbi:glycosyltransferase family 4 protein [Kineococcus sp. DHX-1]|uniref:glycosyltransferase family 4 protein n=1 Tax=Kineococcus sp. DHX-1 TaxID=3349638 RepID=UPI0036D262A7